MTDFGSLLIYAGVGIISFLIGVYITRWIFDIDKIVCNLNKQTEIIESQNVIMVAQLELIASIAEKVGVPLADINGVTSDFGVTFAD